MHLVIKISSEKEEIRFRYQVLDNFEYIIEKMQCKCNAPEYQTVNKMLKTSYIILMEYFFLQYLVHTKYYKVVHKSNLYKGKLMHRELQAKMYAS